MYIWGGYTNVGKLPAQDWIAFSEINIQLSCLEHSLIFLHLVSFFQMSLMWAKDKNAKGKTSVNVCGYSCNVKGSGSVMGANNCPQPPIKNQKEHWLCHWFISFIVYVLVCVSPTSQILKNEFQLWIHKNNFIK